jgi:hypothetical protein
MLGPGNQIQIYQETTVLKPGLVIKLATVETFQLKPQILPDNSINDNNPLMLNLEVFLVAFLLLALPILIYLAYRYGKKMGRKESVPDTHRYFGPEIKRRFSQESTSGNSAQHLDANNDKVSSTTSSPALVPTLSLNEAVIKEDLISPPLSSGRNKREFSVQTEDEKIDELILSDRNNSQPNTECQLVPLINKIDTTDNVENFKIVYAQSCGSDHDDKGVDQELFEEKLKLHSQEGQVVKKEVKYGISFEKKGKHFQKN